jgi:CubicO group peptidase (beta-lactamase class C family)
MKRNHKLYHRIWAFTAITAATLLVVPWPQARPGNLTNTIHVDQRVIESLFSELENDPHHDLKGIVIHQDGRTVDERYFNGDDANTLHDIRSATKSITSALMGIAISQRAVRSVDDPIEMYLPGLPHDGKENITIRDLLTMRSGLAANDEDPRSPGNEDRLDESTDWIKTAYSIPLQSKPGSEYLYCSLNAFLVGAIIENATKRPLDEFARTTLFQPIGIDRFEWRHVPVGRTTGQGNLKITARDLATIGELFANGGKFHGKQIVDNAWTQSSVASQVPISFSDPYSDYYGYMWYTKAEQVGSRSVLVHFASGNGGNKIYIVPSLRIVVAVTSSAYSRGYGQRRSENILLKILAATT